MIKRNNRNGRKEYDTVRKWRSSTGKLNYLRRKLKGWRRQSCAAFPGWGDTLHWGYAKQVAKRWWSVASIRSYASNSWNGTHSLLTSHVFYSTPERKYDFNLVKEFRDENINIWRSKKKQDHLISFLHFPSYSVKCARISRDCRCVSLSIILPGLLPDNEPSVAPRSSWQLEIWVDDKKRTRTSGEKRLKRFIRNYHDDSIFVRGGVN